MTRIIMSVMIVGYLLVADTPKSDKEAIAGSWKVAACELEQKLLPESAFKDLRYTLAADGKWKLEGGSGFPKATAGTFDLDPKTTPKTIDFTPADGIYKGKTFK